MDKRSAAVGLAKRGFPVFALVPGRKIPTAKGWQAQASTHALDAYDHFTRDDGSPADFNIGIRCTLHVVLDVDVPGEGHTIDGRPTLAALGWTGRTLTVRTPSGGLHLYFCKPDGEDYSQADLGPGVNVRSTGGFVAGPGSWTKRIPGVQAEGFYQIVDDSEPAPLPEAIRVKLTPAGSSGTYDESSYGGEWDHPASVDWCWRYIEQHAPEAAKGERGRKGLEIAHVLGDHAISQPLALEMLQAWHETKCDPPEDDTNQMAHVLGSAYRNRKAPFGRDAGHQYLTPIEIPRGLLPELSAPKAPERVPIAQRIFKSRVRCAEDIAKIPRIPWLVPGKFIRGAITGLVSPPGVGKSTISLQWAAALAVGDGAFTAMHKLQDARPVNSLVIGIEDTREIMEQRLAAMCLAFGLDFGEVAERVHLMSGMTGGAVKLMSKEGRGPLSVTADANELQAYMIANNIEAFFVDPLVEIHDGEENDNGEMRKVVALLRSLAINTGAAGTLIHHTRKPPQASSESYAGDQFAGRGASSITAAFRVGLTMFTASEKDAEKLAIPTERRQDWIRLDDSKANWSAKSPHAQWFEREQVELANGESSAILRPRYVDPNADRSGELIAEEIAALMSPGDELSLGAAAAALALRPSFSGKSDRTIRRRIHDAISASPKKTSRGELGLAANGKTGVTITLTRL